MLIVAHLTKELIVSFTEKFNLLIRVLLADKLVLIVNIRELVLKVQCLAFHSHILSQKFQRKVLHFFAGLYWTFDTWKELILLVFCLHF